MAVTVQQIMDRSLKLLVVAGAESDITGSDSDDFIFALNNYMSELESGQYTETVDDETKTYGIDLSWTEVDAVSDTVGVPRSAVKGLCAVMAVEMAPEYGVAVTPELNRLAKDGLNDLIRIGSNTPPMKFPETFPVGSGNEDDGSIYGSEHFYPSDGTI